MDLQGDISNIPKPVLIAGVVVIVLLLLLGIDRFVYPLLPRKSQAVEKLAPPPGFADVPPYNTRGWQEMWKKQQELIKKQGGAAPAGGMGR